MTEEELVKVFEDNMDEEYLKFDRIPKNQRFSERTDLHAFIYLNMLVPGTKDIVAGAGHDEIYLSVGLEELAGVIPVSGVINLIRCGVMLDSETELLKMFV
jgi:hypothetical protein